MTSGGWSAFGPGSAMVGSDVYIIQTNNNQVTVTDAHITSYSGPVVDVTQDLEVGMTEILSSGGFVAEFRRTLSVSDSEDKAISIGENNFIFAFGAGSTVAYHGNNKGVVSLDLSVIPGLSEARFDFGVGRWKFFKLHGITMFILWGVVIPLAGIIVRWMKTKPYWLSLHKFLVEIAAAVTIPLAAVTMTTADGFHSTHAYLGVSVAFFTFAQFLCGRISGYLLKHGKGFPTAIRSFHKWGGRVLVIVGLTTIYLGVGLMDKRMQNAVMVYFTCLVAIFILGEFHMRGLINMSRLFPFLKSGAAVSPYMEEGTLPTWSWAEVKKKVEAGKLLVVYEDVIVDATDFASAHPGKSISNTKLCILLPIYVYVKFSLPDFECFRWITFTPLMCWTRYLRNF